MAGNAICSASLLVTHLIMQFNPVISYHTQFTMWM